MNNVHVETDKSFVDMTVQEKHITVSTDAKLTKKIISRCLKINTQLSLPLRRSHKREKKGLSLTIVSATIRRYGDLLRLCLSGIFAALLISNLSTNSDCKSKSTARHGTTAGSGSVLSEHPRGRVLR